MWEEERKDEFRSRGLFFYLNAMFDQIEFDSFA
jgi:hypothetical protein